MSRTQLSNGVAIDRDQDGSVWIEAGWGWYRSTEADAVAAVTVRPTVMNTPGVHSSILARHGKGMVDEMMALVGDQVGGLVDRTSANLARIQVAPHAQQRVN